MLTRPEVWIVGILAFCVGALVAFLEGEKNMFKAMMVGSSFCMLMFILSN